MHKEADQNYSAEKNLTFAFVLNLVFAIIELVGGLITNSVAIMSDAVHDFGDSLSLGIALYLQRVSKRGGNSRYSYGYRRFSLLGSIFISLILLIGAIFIVEESVKRLLEPQEVDAKGMLLLAIIGIIVNGAAVLRVKKGTTHNERAVFLHLMEDVLGWIAVLIAGIVMLFVNLPFLDPLLSIFITIWVLVNVYRNLRSVVKILLQEVPNSVDIEILKSDLLKLDCTHSIHDLHLWTLDGERHVLTLHLVVKIEFENRTSTAKEMVKQLAASYGISHVTIETETMSESLECDYSCEPCK